MSIVARYFLLSSTRRLGNTWQFAYCAAHSLPADTAQRWLHLLDYPLPVFIATHSGNQAAGISSWEQLSLLSQTSQPNSPQ